MGSYRERRHRYTTRQSSFHLLSDEKYLNEARGFPTLTSIHARLAQVVLFETLNIDDVTRPPTILRRLRFRRELQRRRPLQTRRRIPRYWQRPTLLG